MTIFWTWATFLRIISLNVTYDEKRTYATGESEWMRTMNYARQEAKYDGCQKLKAACADKNMELGVENEPYYEDWECEEMQIDPAIPLVYKCKVSASVYCIVPSPPQPEPEEEGSEPAD